MKVVSKPATIVSPLAYVPWITWSMVNFQGWPKWPEPAEDTSGASGCGGRSRELASRSLPLGTCFDEASVSTS